MVYLTRSALVLESRWKDAMEFAIKARDYIRKDSLVRQADVLMGINGTLSRLHYVIGFDSLADEEKWAIKSGEDEEYRNLLEESLSVSVENSAVDNLYRALP